jgi:predicted Rossmann-fold nucleotide-binding protein
MKRYADEQKKIILVVGSHLEKDGKKHRNKCKFVAEQLADRDVHLLTGGGPGVMANVSNFFFDRPRRGLCLGVLPCATEQGVV